jgi:hypothetical protein
VRAEEWESVVYVNIYITGVHVKTEDRNVSYHHPKTADVNFQVKSFSLHFYRSTESFVKRKKGKE